MERSRIVIKVGSSLLVDETSLAPQYTFMRCLFEDIAALRERGHQVVLLSSGAVAMGLSMVGCVPHSASLSDKQAAAACGQPLLLEAYRSIAQDLHFDIAQVLITLEDIEHRERYDNTANTVERLFTGEVLPIINENDTVATQELRVGDNDRLGAKVAEMIGADQLVILTSVDGLYDRAPNEPGANFIPELTDVSRYLAATEGTSLLGSGGMKTKLLAANMAQQVGCTTLIGEGVLDQPVIGLLDKQRRHTRCLGGRGADCDMGIWLVNRLQVSGAIVVDDALAAALSSGISEVRRDSIEAIHGEFDTGQVVHLYDRQQNELARGIANLSSHQLRLVDELASPELSDVLDEAVPSTVIDSHQMVVINDSMLTLTWEAPASDIPTAA